jgi:hypothetical protein
MSTAVLKKFNCLYFGISDATTLARQDEKEDAKMKRSISIKGAYIGAGSGLVLFAFFGLLPGSLLGGAAGIKLAGMLFGLPLESGLLARTMVLSSMLVGVLVAGIVIVTAMSAAGWLLGRAADIGRWADTPHQHAVMR